MNTAANIAVLNPAQRDEYVAATRRQLARYQAELEKLETTYERTDGSFDSEFTLSAIRATKMEIRELEFRLTDLLIAEVS